MGAINTGDSHLIVDVVREAIGNVRMGGVEVGVYRGETSKKLLEAFPELKLSMVDRWSPPMNEKDMPWLMSGDSCARLTEDEHLANYRFAIDSTIEYQDRRIVFGMDSVRAAQAFRFRSQDFVFLDDDHSYEGVMASIRAWWPKVRIGGILAGHDYNHPRNNRNAFGVNRAVDGFAEETDTIVNTKGSVWWITKN